jgi:heme exporter protein B
MRRNARSGAAMTAVSPLKPMMAVLMKDLRRELRSREMFIAAFLFSIIMLVAIHFAVDAAGLNSKRLGGGAMWLCIVFSGTLAINRSHHSEMDNGAYRALILYPIEGGWLFLAKTLTTSLLLIAMVALLLPMCMLFFRLDISPDPWSLLVSLAAGVLGFAAVGTLTVVITANTRISDVLFPVVQLPLVVPILIAGVNSTDAALQGISGWTWLKLLLAIDIVFLSVGFLLYDFLLEE